MNPTAAARLLAELVEPGGSWQDQALCAQTDPEAFYPDPGTQAFAAKQVCRRCPVTSDCLTHALMNDERHGVWGGLSERERRRLKSAPPPAAAA